MRPVHHNYRCESFSMVSAKYTYVRRTKYVNHNALLNYVYAFMLTYTLTRYMSKGG